jgi:BASS family bile acid:Na+ symporter
VFGYWSCRLLSLDEKSCRTIAFEVGLQNAGLATGLAQEMGKMATVGLAPTVFGSLMNITGATLATWWRDKPVPEDEAATPGSQNAVASAERKT